MFTGLVEAVGRVERAVRDGDSVVLDLLSPIDPGSPGASLAVEGTCLTVTDKQGDRISVVVGPETLLRTTLGDLAPGDQVNLERPLRLGDRLGGHLVQGHVDGMGTITGKQEIGPAVQIWIAAPVALLRYMVIKGSIAVDGISLTINQLAGRTSFEVMLIPHTREQTTLDRKPIGARVNLEVDLLAKYVERLVGAARISYEQQPSPGLTLEFLKEHGFAD